jgi:cytochrome P450
MLDDAFQRYGDTFSLRLPQIPGLVCTADPGAIRQVFTGPNQVLHAGKAAEILRPLVGDNSLLLLDGKAHLRQRRLMLPPFHGERMRQYLDTMRDETIASLKQWPLGSDFAVHPHLQQITLQVILRTIFGVEDAARLQNLADQLTKVIERATPPSVLFELMLPFAVGGRRQSEKEMRKADRMIYDEIERRRNSPNWREKTDVLSLLLAARDEHGEGMSDLELRDELITLLLAGHETTATSLSWTIKLLVENPDVLAKAEEEIDSVVGDEPMAEAHSTRLPYVDAVIRESLRLRPVIMMVGRVLQVPMEFRGFSLPAGAVISPNIYLTHRNPAVYDDPLAFRPERFVNQKPDPYSWLPFGGGIRRCLGMAFAMYEMQVVLATVIQHLRLFAAPDASSDYARRGITIAPADGALVRAARRRTLSDSLAAIA